MITKTQTRLTMCLHRYLLLCIAMLLLCGAIVGIVTTAQHIQEQQLRERAAVLLRSMSVFVPAVLEDQKSMGAYLAALRAGEDSVSSISIVAPHGNGAWRVYITDEGSGGSVTTFDSSTQALVQHAWETPGSLYTGTIRTSNDTGYVATRALVDLRGEVTAVVILQLHTSESDRALFSSLAVVAVLLFVVLLLFVAHIIFLRRTPVGEPAATRTETR